MKIRGSFSSILLLICFLALCIPATLWFTQAATVPAGPSGYHLINSYKLGGEGGWDYLTMDSAARRLYISRSTHVMVMDADSGKIVGDVPDTPGVHGIALIQSLNRGFTSNGRGGNVSAFDLMTLKPDGNVQTGQNPDAIIYDPGSNHVFTMNGGSNDSSAIDPVEMKIAATIPLEGRPEFAASDAAGHVYVNLEDKAIMVQIDSEGLRVRRHWPMTGCEEPSGLAIDREHHRLFAGCHNLKMLIMDSNDGHVVGSVPIGQGVDANAFDPGTQLAFSSNGDGTLTVVKEESPDKFTVVENVPTKRGARTMALDEKTHNVYLVTAEFGTPPEPTAEHPRPRPPMLPDSFVVLVFGK